VLEAQSDAAVQRIVFAGHSLGGAIALLAHLWACVNALTKVRRSHTPSHRSCSAILQTFHAPIEEDINLTHVAAEEMNMLSCVRRLNV
jgi:hypothetical protein